MGFIENAAVLVRKYAPQYGIKVYSPIIAQMILESAKGTSELAVNAHNYTGLKYREGRCPTACGVYYKVGSEQNPDGSYTNSAMKWFKFPDMESGIRGYFDFINIPNYSEVKGVTDPRTYLEILKSKNFATSHKYVDNVMAVIERYHLTKYDGEVRSMPKVFLSAGHGGSDAGATAYGLKEKDINLQIMLACKAELERHGVTVVCSRLKDENDPVAQEVKEANASGADVAVSFHTNSDALGKGDGSESFYYKGSLNGKRLAELCEKYVGELGQNSRGVKTNNLYFTRETTMTAVLCECAFIKTAKDIQIVDTVAEQKKFGVAYAKAILEYLKIAYKSQEPVKEGLYRVQVGAFGSKTNAEKLLNELKSKGYSGIIV